MTEEQLYAKADHSSPVTAELDSVYDALVQAQDCIRGETPEDITDAEAREDTINKVREAMRQVEAMRHPAQQPASPVKETDLLARLRDFVAAESKRWVNCGTGELERIEVSPAGKLAQEAVEAIESAITRPDGGGG